jgi:hypothetical protein
VVWLTFLLKRTQPVEEGSFALIHLVL